MSDLRFEHVSLTYGDARDGGRLAVDGLDFALAAGESVALIGPSGCGKSSALKMASGLLAPSDGAVLVDGQPADCRQGRSALILQSFGLLPWKDVLSNAALGLKMRGVARAEREQRARAALELVGLSAFADAYPAQLSGGMQQRLAIARALALDTGLLLMDEPLSALDALLREQLQDTLLELWRSQGYAQLLVTHSIDEAVYLGQRIVVMSASPGRVIGVFENPDVGQDGYRGSDAFHARVDAVRDLLRSTKAAGAAGEGDANA